MTEKEVILATTCVFLGVFIFSIVEKGLKNQLEISSVIVNLLIMGMMLPVFILINLRIAGYHKKGLHSFSSVRESKN